jgi:hypothetical protein
VTCQFLYEFVGRREGSVKLTFHVNYALLEDLLKDLWVFKLLLNLADDRLSKLLLFTLLHLAFIANP